MWQPETAERASNTLSIVAAAKALFLGDDGALKPDAEIFLAELERRCYVNRSTLLDAMDDIGRRDPLLVCELEGRRSVALWLRGMIFYSDAEMKELGAQLEGGEEQ